MCVRRILFLVYLYFTRLLSASNLLRAYYTNFICFEFKFNSIGKFRLLFFLTKRLSEIQGRSSSPLFPFYFFLFVSMDKYEKRSKREPPVTEMRGIDGKACIQLLLLEGCPYCIFGKLKAFWLSSPTTKQACGRLAI